MHNNIFKSLVNIENKLNNLSFFIQICFNLNRHSKATKKHKNANKLCIIHCYIKKIKDLIITLI